MAVRSRLVHRIRASRRTRGLSQQRIAALLGVTQPTISRFERGHDTLSAANVSKLLNVLELSADEDDQHVAAEALLPSDSIDVGTILWFCSDADCPSHFPWQMGDRCLLVPRPIRCAPTAAPRCPDCGEVLESTCPHCRHGVNEGACCVRCGTEYIAPITGRIAARRHVRRRSATLRELRAHTQPRIVDPGGLPG